METETVEVYEDGQKVDEYTVEIPPEEVEREALCDDAEAAVARLIELYDKGLVNLTPEEQAEIAGLALRWIAARAKAGS